MKLIEADASKIVLENNGHQITKELRISDCAAWYQILRRIREAEREFLYRDHGDRWPDFAEPNRFWGTEMTEEEASLLKGALAKT